MVLEKTTLQVEKGLLEKFQEAVVRRFGKLKGAQSEALAEAMKLWLSYTGEERYFTVEGSIMSLDEVAKLVAEKVKDGSLQRSDITMVPLAFSLHEDEINEVRRAFEKILSKPTKATISEENSYLRWDISDDTELVVYFWTYFVGAGIREKKLEGFKEF